VPFVHFHGINLRHLGALRMALPKEDYDLRTLLLVEMSARVIKNQLNQKLRFVNNKFALEL